LPTQKNMKCPKCRKDNLSDSKYCQECAEPLYENLLITQTQTLKKAGKALSPGSIFAGKYQIIEEIGKGGMGWVYRAFDREIEEYVAIKIIRPEIADDKNIIQRFRNELKIARKISHKNVCRMFDLNKEGDIVYITMEYVQGEDLQSSIRRMGLLSIGKSIFIAKQICEGLSEAHRLGVTHRDLKPQNIMIDWDGNARIMDFGIARSRETEGITDSRGVVGTATYMSPEQVEGITVDIRSDIYSLGIILYELVTGCVPFNGNTPMSVALKRILQAPAEPRKINTQIPGELSKVIMTCINKDRDKRYQSTKELLLALSEIEAQLPTTEKIISKPKSYTTKKITASLKSKKFLITAASICMAAVAAILLWILVSKPEVQTKVIPSSPTAGPAAAVPEKQEPESKPTEKTSLVKQKPESKPTEKTIPEKQEEIVPSASIPQTPVKKPAQTSITTARKKAAEKRQNMEQEIRTNLKQAQAAFDKGDFQACIELSEKILRLDPDNAAAAEHTKLAEKELATAYIGSLIEQFNSAVNDKTLPEFYQNACSSEIYQKIQKSAERIMASYESLKSVTSDPSLQVIGTGHLQVSFPNITLGVRKQGERQQVLFEGIYTWEIKKSEDTWKIINIKTAAIKKSIKKEKT